MLHRINKPILKYIKQNVNVLIKERLSKYNISLIFPCDAETKTFQLSMKEKEKILLFEMLLLKEAIRKNVSLLDIVENGGEGSNGIQKF